MINKKLLAVVSVAAVISASSAFAKTEGNYFGVDILNTRPTLSYDKVQGSSVKNTFGAGLSYKHAFNFDGLFVAPGAFVERNNTKVDNSSLAHGSINNRYGVKADLGYDLNKDLAVYAVGGLSFLKYSITDSDGGKQASRGTPNFFYGVGISHEYSENVNFSLEYNTQTLEVKTRRLASVNKVKADINVIKAGVSYRF